MEGQIPVPAARVCSGTIGRRRREGRDQVTYVEAGDHVNHVVSRLLRQLPSSGLTGHCRCAADKQAVQRPADGPQRLSRTARA